MHDVSNIYRVPLLLHHQGVTDNLLRRLNLVPKPNKAFFNDWMSLAELVDSLTLKVHIAVPNPNPNPNPDPNLTPGAHRRRGQVHGALGRVPLGDQGAAPRLLPRRAQARHRGEG